MDIEVNYVAILVASVVSMVVGFLWYSPLVVGKQWTREMGLTQDKLKKAQKEMGKLYGLSFVVSLVTAYVLSHVMALSANYYGYPELQTGITTAFWMWVGFVMPVQCTNTIFTDKNWKLFGMNTGYQLASLLTMGVTVALF